MSLALRITNLGKRYRIGNYQTGINLKHLFKRQWTKITGRNTAIPELAPSDEFWALNDLSLEVNTGEVVGIIGRNGAGKSTLLKILSRITAPTSGRAEVYGAMASLLEVGTGFHGELTGRENIFLNGSILGMSRSNIREKLDEIISFAEIDKFIDTPVKRYSSGMYVRLAFSVAAHLNPEILVIDEVLSVGDLPFQKKCLSKMDGIANQGRTVLFVSHNLIAVRQLCPRSVLIDKGKLVYDGPTNQTLDEYRSRLKEKTSIIHLNLNERASNFSGSARFTSFKVLDEKENERYEFEMGETICIQVSYEVYENIPDLLIYFSLESEISGETLVVKKQPLSTTTVNEGKKGLIKWVIPNPQLVPRDYLPYVWIGNMLRQPYDRINYSATACPPIRILSKDSGPEKEHEGYFIMPSMLEVS